MYNPRKHVLFQGIVRVYTDTGLEGWGYIRVSSPLDIPVFTLLHLSTVCIPDLQGIVTRLLIC